jgi:hypothetical protein
MSPTLQEIVTAKQIALDTMCKGPIMHTALLDVWRSAIDKVWDHDRPDLVLAEFGTHAARLFANSNATIALLEFMEPGCTVDRLAKIHPCTAHVDGTVTINET